MLVAVITNIVNQYTAQWWQQPLQLAGENLMGVWLEEEEEEEKVMMTVPFYVSKSRDRSSNLGGNIG